MDRSVPGGINSKITETDWLASIVTTQVVAFPVHEPPLQAAIRQPVSGVAVRVTTVASSKGALPDVPPVAMEMPAGPEDTVPEPDLVTLNVNWFAATGVNVTDADISALIVSWQVVVAAAQSPPQLASCQPAAAVAVSVTDVPSSNVALPDVPPTAMEIPVGLDSTVPEPVFVMLNVNWVGTGVKVAEADRLELIVTWQVVAAVEQSPPQLENSQPAAGVAVRVTEVFSLYSDELDPPFAFVEIPPGLDVTPPSPDWVTVRVNFVGARASVTPQLAMTVLAASARNTNGDRFGRRLVCPLLS